MAFSWKKAIEDADKLKLADCKILVKQNEDYRVKHVAEARDADSDKPNYIEMKKRLKVESDKRKQRIERQAVHAFANKVKRAIKS